MKYHVGMCGGCFAPLHLGHKHMIMTAANQCDTLFVILSVSKYDEIPYQLRFRWLKQMTREMENVIVLTVFDESKNKDEYDWKTGSDMIKSMINEPIDAVFCGSDYDKEDNPFKINYPDSEIVYIDRHMLNISSTMIRNNPYAYWDFLAPEAREYYVKKVVVLGSESCGKSTLVRNLAQYFGTECVEEKGRDICDFAGGIDNMIPSDFVEILYKHKVDEIEKTRKANRVLFIDTEAYVTDYYLKLQFEGTDVDITKENSLALSVGSLNKYDLVLYLEPDVPWVQDGTRTYGEESVRIANDLKLKKILSQAGLEYTVINGDYQEKYQKVIELVNNLLKGE